MQKNQPICLVFLVGAGGGLFAGDPGSIPGSGTSFGEGNGSPLQYSCLETPHGQRSLAGYSPRGHKESDTTERLSTAQHVVPDRRILRGFSALGS